MLTRAVMIILENLYKRAVNSFGVFSDRYDIYAAVVTLVSLLSIFLIIYVTFKMEKNRLFYGFLFLLTSITFWIYADLQKYLVSDPFLIMNWIRFEYLARLLSGVAWYLFAEVYTKRNDKINRAAFGALFLAVPVLYTIFSFQPYKLITSRAIYASNLHVILGYAFMTLITVGSIIKLHKFAKRQRGIYIKQVQLITAGIVFVIIMDALNFFCVFKTPVDLVPFGFLMFEFFIWKAITKYRLMEVVPIALREVFNNMNDGVIVLNEDGSIIDLNNTAKQYIGKYYNPKTDVTISDIVMNLSSKIDNSALVLGKIKEALRLNGRPLNMELTIKDKPLKYFSIKLGQIKDSRKRTIGHIVNIDDITEYKMLLLENEEQNFKLHEQNEELEAQKEELEAQRDELEAQKQEVMDINKQLEDAYKELQETQSQLIQTEKMAALGQLVAGVAHEINTPLGSINSNIEITKLIASKLSNIGNKINDEEMLKLIEKFNKMNEINSIACNRILEIVRSLKNFSRLDEAEFQTANVHEGIDSTLILINNQIKNRITIHRNYGDLPEIECYPNQLNQVFMNILVNASQAIEDKGDIYITTYRKDETAVIEITDSGKGIKKENLEKVFDPGFTTKGVGVGTGLGLSICYKIIQKHNGSIHAENAEGLGAKFIIQLPITNCIEKCSGEV
ncbi:MAG: ATP-binding protein [Bacillota bacterium]